MPFRLRPQPARRPLTTKRRRTWSGPSAQDIYEQVANNARQELGRSSVVARHLRTGGRNLHGAFGTGQRDRDRAADARRARRRRPTTLFIAKMFYPLGFIVVILGRSQLFTENTLYPVALVLAEKKHFWKTMQLWGIVLPSNVLGALAFAAIAGLTGALRPDMVQALSQLGLEALHHPAQTIFWSGVMGGWIIATVAWLVSGSHSITGSVMIIWMLAFVVGLGNFAHCIAASGEILTAVLIGQAPLIGLSAAGLGWRWRAISAAAWAW